MRILKFMIQFINFVVKINLFHLMDAGSSLLRSRTRSWSGIMAAADFRQKLGLFWCPVHHQIIMRVTNIRPSLGGTTDWMLMDAEWSIESIHQDLIEGITLFPWCIGIGKLLFHQLAPDQDCDWPNMEDWCLSGTWICYKMICCTILWLANSR